MIARPRVRHRGFSTNPHFSHYEANIYHYTCFNTPSFPLFASTTFPNAPVTMPTHTPSPYRFLAPHPPSSQKSRPKPQSSLRHGFTAHTSGSLNNAIHTTFSEAETPKQTSARRFVIAPVRNTASRGRDDEAWASSGQTHSTPQLKPKRTFQRVESIEEGLQETLAPALNDEDHEDGIAQSVEQRALFTSDGEEQEDGDSNDDGDGEMLFESADRNKRRRISPQPPSSPTQSRSRDQHPPQTPAPTAPGASSHRFLVPAPRTPASFSNNPNPSSSCNTTTTPAPSRPHFRLPPQSPSPQKPTTPLPEFFSPSRKGQKYIPGGLASTLQSWIVETANTGYAAQTGNLNVSFGRDREEGVKMKIRITSVHSSKTGRTDTRGELGGDDGVDCYPGGVVFIKGNTDVALYNASRAPGEARDSDVGVLLAGQGGARGAGSVRIREGSVVGIRAPMWEVDIAGEKWSVGVDWVVL